MTALLVVLLLFAIAGLGLVGFFALQFYLRAVRLDAAFAAHEELHATETTKAKDYAESVKSRYQDVVTKYSEDSSKWKDHSTTLRAEIQRLSRWKNIADADAKAAEMLRTAEKT